MGLQSNNSEQQLLRTANAITKNYNTDECLRQFIAKGIPLV